jgi:protocatechuate 3,4-dioxygenase beta subunit
MTVSFASTRALPHLSPRVLLVAALLALATVFVAGARPAAAATLVPLSNAPQTSNCGGGQVTWHFVINQIDPGTTISAFSATFTSAGLVTTFTSDANPAVIHVFVTTPTDDTLTAATATLSNQTGTPRMVLSDFRCVPTVLKDGSKFHDLNANSVWDAGEPGLANWTIQAVQGGVVVASTTTDTNGYYYFLLTPGTYTFREVCPAGAGWRQSVPGPLTSAANCGANTITETLVLGAPSHDNNFGNFQNATKSGYKFHDLNANGVWDAGEAGLPNWTIKAFQGATEVASTTTDANGFYSFSLTPGSYSIREVCPAGAGWRQSYPTPITSAANCGANTHEITLTSGQVDANNNFGNFQNATKSGYKFHDLNKNGSWDAGEPALSGWDIHLFGSGADGAVHLVATTNASGQYTFSVAPGSYTVCEILKTDWFQSYPTAATTGAVDCSTHTHGGTVTPGAWGWGITLTSGQQDLDNNFGNHFRFEGCTPGYWKVPQHWDSWIPTGYETTDLLKDVFGANALNGTLLDGLNFQGGSGVTGAKQILLRAAVAALLNASHPDIAYPLTETQVINMVTAALNTGNRGTMLTLANQLDGLNNLGCPLN